MRFFGSEAPWSTAPEPELAEYIDRYHQLVNELGPEDGEAKFMEDYPDYFDLTFSLTADNAGVRANVQSFNEAKKWRDLIATAPEYGRIYSGAGALEPGWSQGVYESEKFQDIARTTTTNWRAQRDPQVIYKETEAQEGWAEYRKFMTALNLKLEDEGLARGLTNGAGEPKALSLRTNAAEPYREIRTQFLADLAKENKSWSHDFNQGYTRESALNLLNHFAGTLADHPKLAERHDMKQLQKYITMRAKVRKYMVENDISNINSEAAAEVKPGEQTSLASDWDDFTALLVTADPVYEQNIWIMGNLQADDLSGDVSQ
jgi:hypothetical protein